MQNTTAEFLIQYISFIVPLGVALGSIIVVFVAQRIKKSSIPDPERSQDENENILDADFLPPEKTMGERYINKKLLMVLVLYLISCVVLIGQVPENGEEIAQQSAIAFLLINSTSTLFLGFFLNNWWEFANSPNENRQRAIAISREVDIYLLDVLFRMEKAVSDLENLARDKVTKKTEPLIKHFLSVQDAEVRHYVRRAGNEISNLWPVNDYRAIQIVESFFEQKNSKIQAISEATNSILSEMLEGAISRQYTSPDIMDQNNGSFALPSPDDA